MNKIYKVIWSKVRNCYVAVSEIAKRNGKSCTSVNCGAKVNRRSVRVLLAIAAAFCVVPVNVLAANSGGHVNDAGNYVGDSPYIVVIDGGHDGAVDGKYGEDSAQNAQVTIKSGTVTGNVCGGWTYGTGINATGNIVKITGGTVNGYVCGSYAASGIATGIVEITDGEIKNVYGSRSQSGTAKESHVTVEKFTTSETGGIEIYGGYTSAYDPFSGNTDNGATDNIVTLKGSENGRIKRVYGGYVQGAGAGSAINNTVELDGYQYYGNSTNLYGGWVGGTGDSITGNKLLLSNVYNKVGWIYNFETIKLANSINWTPGGFVLSAFGYKNGDNGEPAMILDITDAFTNFKQATERGTMRLLNSVNLHQLSTIKLKYNSSAAEALPSTTNKKVVKAGTAKTSPANGVTIGYNENEHVVSFESSDAYYNQYERICYTIADNATSVSFGNMAWGTGRELTDGQFSFNSDTTINASNLTFSNKATTALKTDGTSTMTLLSNASGLKSTNEVSQQPGTNKGTVAVEYKDDNNITFNATAKGHVESATNAVKYVVDSVEVSGVNLASWNGSSISAIPTGWTKKSDGNISVTTGGFTAPTDITAGNSKNIVTTSTANFFNNVTIGTGNEYKSYSFSNEPASGSDVTFTGTQYKGVKVDSTSTTTVKDKLVYAVDKKNVSTISLGAMTWGTGRTAGSDYSFGSVTGINASGLTFAFTNSQTANLSKTSSMTLLSSATGLTSGKTVNYGTGKNNHSQSVTCNRTNVASLTGTLTGEIASGSEVITYSASSMTLDSVNLGSWNGSMISSVPSGWTAKSGGISVATAGLTVPTDVGAGSSKNILTTNTTNYFSNATIGVGNEYKSYSFSNDSLNKVTFTGSQYKGVTTNANKSSLVYAVGKKNVSTVSFDAMTWGTGRSANSDYNFETVSSINASNLTFTGTIGSDPIGQYMTLLSGNTNITGTITQPTGTGKGTVAVRYSNSANNVQFDATAKGTVTVAAKTVKYTLNSASLYKATLGTFTWGTSASMPSTSGWSASDSTTIDDTNFAYSDSVAAESKLVAGNTAVIFNATGLKTASPVTLGVNANKTVGMNFTDNGTNGSGFNFVGTVNGHVATANDVANYMVDSVTLNSINLKSWTGNPYNIASTDGWVLSTNDQSVVNAVVNTSDFSLPSGMTLATGEKKVIVTAEGKDYFKDIRITGTSNVWSEGGALSDTESDSGVSVTGTQTTGGVKVNELDKNQIIYESSKKNITTITLGTVPEFKYDGTAARTFDSEYDVSTASITTTAFKFADTSPMEAGDVMTIIDATNAITYAASGQTLKDFDTVTNLEVDFTDTITDPTNNSATDKIEFTGKHSDTLSLNEASTGVKAKTKLIYTVGDKVVDTATLSGPITWTAGGTYYTNGMASNQKNRNSVFTFDANSKIDISGVDFTATTDPLNKTMTLISGNTINSVAKNVAGSFTDGKDTPRSFGVVLSRANGTLEAKASGYAEITTGGNLTYTVNGVAIDKINVTSITNDADTVPTGWTLAKDSSDKVIAKVETDGLVVASPSGLEPGETKVIMEAASGSTAFFKDVSVNGSHAWKVDGSTITSDLDIGGVAITGTQTKGGVKVNEANTNQIIYEESKKSINTLTLGSVTFANDDGTAATVARTFDKTYDVSTATINADDLAFANSDIMETGNSMRIVDASAAIPNAISNKKLSAFAGQTYEVAFSDTITGKNLTLKGTHTDTLSQDAAQTTLTYTVGDKVVSSATLNGTVNWSDGASYYTNGTDVNQNNVAATYTFDGNTSVDISGVQFNARVDPLAGSTKSMTLLKGVTGVVATKVSGTPSFAVTLDQTNTKLDAKATGASGVSGNDVTFTVSGVTLDKITVKSANGTADKVPASWTMAAGATIETESMTVPELAAGTHVDILQSDTDGFFAKVAINGANAYGNTQDAFTESDAAKSVTIAGTQDKGVTLNTEKKHLIYKAGTLDVASVTLGLAKWKKGATVFDRSGAGYNYAGVAALGTDGFAVSYASPETVATGDSMTLLQANATLKDMAEQVKKTSYSYTPMTGVTVDAAVTGSLEAKGGNVTYTVTANQASKLTFTNVDWKDSGALMTRPSNITFAGADVDTAKIHFQNVKELDANRKMTLVSDFGDSVGTITGTKYTVGAGLEGEGAASLSGSDLIFTTKTGARDLAALAQTHNTLMVMEAGMAVLAAGREHLGQAMVGLADPQNAGSDGTRIGASMGGGWSRYKTGSHVDSNNWNVAVAVGSKRELKKGSLEWGVFGEYGKSNYTLHSDAGRGDGDSHYAGGGLMAKWTNKHDVYTEASVRLGRLNDTASNLLRDAAGNGYGYDVHANYFGAHVGIGKIINYKGGKSLDVYGKYFYTKRDGVDFASGGNNYSLDSVASSILRVGARYGTTDKKWNWYGGLAYEYEFDGKSEGTVDGVGIRAASIKGGSVRGEIGLRMSATKTNPWQTDISIYGYGGKHRGFGGSVNVAYMF